MRASSILFLACILIISACDSNLKVENYFLPKGFEGNVAVIYSNDSLEADTLNYQVPESGILMTKYGFFKGRYKINYYQLNENNKYDTLVQELPTQAPDLSKNRIYFNRILTFQRNKSDTIYTVGTFYVGKKPASELEKDRFFFERKLEKMLLGR